MNRLVQSCIVFLCVVSLASLGNAQSKVALGAYIGPNFANLSTDPDLNTDSRTGLLLGGFAEIELSKMWYIEAGVAYVQGGAEFSLLTMKYDYLQIPVRAKVKFPLAGSSFQPLLYAGVNLGFNMNAEWSALGETIDMKDYTESMNIGLDFGVGAEYALNPSTSLFATLGYSAGLSDIFKETGTLTEEDISGTFKTSAIPIALGVRFAL